MSWVRLDDQFAHHPKVLRAGPTASFLWIACIAYCQKFLTDGFVPEQAIPTVAGVSDTQECVAQLVKCGLLEPTDGGFQIHDFLEYNDSADQVKADRAWDKKRKALYSSPDLVLAIKTRDQNRCRYCNVKVNWADRRGPTGGQFDHVNPRGDNTLDNLVVACRKCNSRKGNRLPAVVGLKLTPVEPIQNQNGTSSELDLRARARSPSHPIPSKEDQLKRIGNQQQENHSISTAEKPTTTAEVKPKKEKPIISGKVLTIHRWMVEECEKTLGGYAKEFDVLGWLWLLDERAWNDNLVMPKRDNGEWLQAELVAEAQRRGLPLRFPAAPKQSAWEQEVWARRKAGL